TGGCNKDCSEELSSCLMAHINSASVHIPLWMTSPMTTVGWGQSPYYPTAEGTFFGQILVTNASNALDAYYCNSPSVSNDVVPGRLGSNQGSVPYSNAWPKTANMDGLCQTSHSTGGCAMHPLAAGETVSDGAESCTLNGTTWTHPISVWRGQIFQAEKATIPNANMIVYDAANSNGARVGNIGPTASVKFTNVMAGAAGSNNLVVYFANGDCPTGNLRYFNIKVNGGAAQSRSFASISCGNWDAIGQTMVTLSGFTAGSTNTVEFLGDGTHAAPDLDWIEVMAAPGASAPTGTTKGCAVGNTVAIQSMQNLLYSSARSDNNLNVMAQASTVSTWEQYDIVDAGGGFVALKSHMNNDYVSADLSVSASAPLRARSTTIGAWEQFKFVQQSNGYYAIQANANGKYVSARIDTASTPLQALAASPSAWEYFSCQ
ncbi:MAG TPA: hypothetical protein VK989_11970, partial [Polyangia bacterium]|nr:hypothetical protein [Polyangia bacterium]